MHLICQRNGIVEQFNLNQAQGIALVAYKNREDAMKACQVLNSPSLGFTANFVNPNDIGALIGGGGGTGSQWSNGQNKMGWDDGSMSNHSQWNGGLGGGLTGMQGSLWSPSPGGPMSASMGSGMGTGMSTGIGTWGLLPEDLLN